MKPREFQLDAWEVARQQNYPGCVALIKYSMEFGYARALTDCVKELESLKKELEELRRRANAPQ